MTGWSCGLLFGLSSLQFLKQLPIIVKYSKLWLPFCSAEQNNFRNFIKRSPKGNFCDFFFLNLAICLGGEVV